MSNYFEMLQIILKANILEYADLIWVIKSYVHNLLLGKLF